MSNIHTINMSNIHITACGKKDGVGSQVLSKILAIMFCKKNNFTYVHTPLQFLDYKNQDPHGEKEYKLGRESKYVHEWNEMLNIGYSFKHREDLLGKHTIDLLKLLCHLLFHFQMYQNIEFFF